MRYFLYLIKRAIHVIFYIAVLIMITLQFVIIGMLMDAHVISLKTYSDLFDLNHMIINGLMTGKIGERVGDKPNE